MTLYQWFIFFLIIQVVHFISTWKLYQKAGRKSWEAAIPVYNSIVLMKIINRPTWWTILLFIPIINLIMIPVVWVETIRSFGKNTSLDTVLVLFTFGLYIAYINYTQDVVHIKDRSLVSPTKAGDTVSSLLFAIVVATLVHTYVMQPFTIPTSSLEKTLLVGDFLFVSKFHYGARTPMTTVALPMVHDSIPFIHVKSYVSKPQLPYFRFPGFEKAEKNDIVVFNWPNDTVYKFFDRSGRRADKPLDKRSNYVKRCVGTPGDNLSIKNGTVFIDGKELVLSGRAKVQFGYFVKLKENNLQLVLDQNNITEYTPYYTIPNIIWDKPGVKEYFNGSNQLLEILKDSLFTTVKLQSHIEQKTAEQLNMNIALNAAELNMTDELAAQLKNNSGIEKVEKIVNPVTKSVFPHNKDWSIDNYGPIYIPEAGKTVALNAETLPLYKRIIEVYEHNDLKVNGEQISINGAVATSYTFKQDYYWMMGDNRHRSEDSRYWGFVPADHVVGKPVFIWMSLDPNVPWSKAFDKIRWDRMFTTVGGDDEPYSYFKFFILALVAYFGISYFMKRKKAQRS